MGIRRKIYLISVLSLVILTIGGCSDSKTTQINVLATTDLHGQVPYNLGQYVIEERKKDKNITLVDAGDFFDDDGYGPMDKYYHDRVDNDELENIKLGNEYVEFPLASDMSEVGYDAVVLGNHEFVSNNRFYLDNMISDFKKKNIDVLSANTYKEGDKNYVKPYTIKEIETEDGVVRLGILGLTIKEVDEGKYIDENGNLVKAKSRELKDMYGYDGKLYINDIVDEANKWSKIMKEDDKADIIVAVAHSGEKPKKPENPGNRIQEIAMESEYIDAIVAGHTHIKFDQHDYKNKNDENVIVTQPGARGEYISKITFDLEYKNGQWNIANKESKLKELEKDKSEEYAGEVIYKIASIKKEISEVRLKELTPFEWDKAYVFETNTPVEKIYEIVGYKWKSIVETTKDSMLQTVFMKDNKVVCYLAGDTEIMGISINYDKSNYEDSILEIYPNKNDKFSIKKGNEVFETYLTYIGE